MILNPVLIFEAMNPTKTKDKEERSEVTNQRKSADQRSWWIVALLSLVTFLAYSNSFHGPFVFDDETSITRNPTIRSLWPLSGPLSPPKVNVTAQGRPILNLSLAVNHAISGDAVGSYHVVNFLIHLGAGLFLFGLIRRTLLLPNFRARFGSSAPILAAAAAAWWLLHPLQTESVTYVIQRAESLMGFFYLLTFYAFVRAFEPASVASKPWQLLAVIACFAGMGTKEVMVSAPVMLLLYDRTFLAGNFVGAWRSRRGFYFALATSWLVLAWLVLGAGGNRGGSVGFNSGVAWWDYGLTQFQAVIHYLQLSIWPHPLVFEYGTAWVEQPWSVVPWAVLLFTLIAATVVALMRWPALGFLGAWFFAILAPTSLTPGTTQMIVEHRMYLALAAVLISLTLGVYRWLGTKGLNAIAVVALACGAATFLRNRDYQSEVGLWEKTVAQRPHNALAHLMLASALEKTNATNDAIAHYETALTINPRFSLVHDSLGQALLRAGKLSEATEHFETAVSLKPDFADAHDHLGTALARQGRADEAIAQFNAALAIDPAYAEAHYNLGNLLAQVGRPTEAIPHYEAALRAKPTFVEARFNLANALGETGRTKEAIAAYERTLEQRPVYPAAEYNLANLLAMTGRQREAIAHYEAAVRQKPDYAEAYNNWGSALLELGRGDKAAQQYEAALRADPNFGEARDHLTHLRLHPIHE